MRRSKRPSLRDVSNAGWRSIAGTGDRYTRRYPELRAISLALPSTVGELLFANRSALGGVGRPVTWTANRRYDRDTPSGFRQSAQRNRSRFSKRLNDPSSSGSTSGTAFSTSRSSIESTLVPHSGQLSVSDIRTHTVEESINVAS